MQHPVPSSVRQKGSPEGGIPKQRPTVLQDLPQSALERVLRHLLPDSNATFVASQHFPPLIYDPNGGMPDSEAHQFSGPIQRRLYADAPSARQASLLASHPVLSRMQSPVMTQRAQDLASAEAVCKRWRALAGNVSAAPFRNMATVYKPQFAGTPQPMLLCSLPPELQTLFLSGWSPARDLSGEGAACLQEMRESSSQVAAHESCTVAHVRDQTMCT